MIKHRLLVNAQSKTISIILSQL